MFIKLYCLLSLLCWSNLSLAQAQDDHLVPTSGYLFSHSFENTYYPKVRELLYADLSDSPLARVVVLPSFTPEYMLTIERQQKQVYLVYRTCQPSIWSTLPLHSTTNAGKQPIVETKKLEVSSDLATTVAALFNAAIAQTKYPEPKMEERSDGTTFIFSSNRPGIGLQGGKMWSPQMGTNMSALESIVNQLRQLATANKSDRQSLTGSLINQASKLAAELKVH